MIGQRSYEGTAAGRVIIALAALCVSNFVTGATACAQPRISENKGLRIASWNLSDAAKTGVIAREEPVTKSWRNTFGAERRIAAKPKFAGDRLQADVVLLQGVTSVREVRQIFPARGWKLILSRQVLKLGNGRLNQDSAVAGEQTITAVAVRYQLRLRVTALEHLDNLDGTQVETSDQSAGGANDAGTGISTAGEGVVEAAPSAAKPTLGPASKATGEQFPDGLALRLAYSGSVIWVVSVVLPSRCRTSSQTCQPAVRLKQWADGKRADGIGVIMGGQLDGTLRQAGPNGVCANQEIVADRALQAETGADTVAGCVTFADIESS